MCVPTLTADERQPCSGRYVHFWTAATGHPSVMALGSYVGKDGHYAGLLLLKKRAENLQLPTDAGSFEAMVRAALPQLPEVWPLRS